MARAFCATGTASLLEYNAQPFRAVALSEHKQERLGAAIAAPEASAGNEIDSNCKEDQHGSGGNDALQEPRLDSA